MRKKISYFKHPFMALMDLWQNPLFIVLTILGNSAVLIFAYLFYLIEQGQPALTFEDSLWFSFYTVTSVGYGDILPHTSVGRALAVVMMLVGSALFACYTALFANSFLKRDLSTIRHLEKDLEEEETHLESLIVELKSLAAKLEKSRKNIPKK